MNEGLISSRYARALLKYAREHGVEERVYDEVRILEQSFETHPALQKALINPVLSAKEKDSLLATAAGEKPSEEFLRFVHLVTGNRREEFIRPIGLMYQKFYRASKGISQVRIITAIEIDANTLGKIKDLIRQKVNDTVEFVYEVDPSIIGGFVLKVDSMQLDASVDSELKQLRLKLLNSKKRL